MIYVTGDCHQDFSKFSMKNFPDQKSLTKDDFVIVCGDFGGIFSVVNGRFCPQSVRSFCPVVAGFNAGTYKVPACVL